nr:MAG TPA: hypothetical protein [Caudoviricetes sp.]
MSVLHLVLTVVWLFVSVAFALLARFKHKLDMGFRIWPDVLASVSAGVVAICYIVQIALEVAA